MKKNIGKGLLILLLIVVTAYGYVQYKEVHVKNKVYAYLIHEKDMKKTDIVSTEPFIANLPGAKNWLVAVKLKNDKKTYYYYENEKGKVLLESDVYGSNEE